MIQYFARYGVDRQTLEQALSLALARGASRADVFLQDRAYVSARHDQHGTQRVGLRGQSGVAVRIVKGGQIRFGYTEGIHPDIILELARALALAGEGGALASAPALAWPSTLAELDARTAGYRPRLATLRDQLAAANPRIERVDVALGSEFDATLVADSNTGISETVEPLTSTFLFSCLARVGDRREFNSYDYAVIGEPGLDDAARFDRMIQEVVRRTLVLFEATPAPAGELPVVMAGGSAGILLHEAIGHGLEADFNRAGTSAYAGRMGARVARPFVTVVDDDGLGRSQRHDDEGVAITRTTLIEQGVLAGYLHDTASAHHFATRPTGHGRRDSHRHLPLPRMRATYLLPGPHDRDEIVASVERGVFCHGTPRGKVDVGTGNIDVRISNGWLIEGGRLTRPLRDIHLVGSGPEMLGRIDMVSNDLGELESGACVKQGQRVSVRHGMPTIRVNALRLMPA